jgi:uncharacterized membrane protein
MAPHMRGDLAAATAAAAAAVVAVWSIPDHLVVLRAVLAVALVLVLPGYALTAALFPTRSLGLPERLLLAVALSVSIAIVGGLVLNGVAIRLHERSWVTLLASVTTAAALVATFRSRDAAPRSQPREWARPSAYQLAAFAVALLLLGGATALGRAPLRAKHVAGYTALWLVQSDGDLALGVRSGEQGATSYRVEMRVHDLVTRRWSFRLTPGKTWQLRVRRPGQGPVVASLYRGHGSQVYRRVELHVG